MARLLALLLLLLAPGLAAAGPRILVMGDSMMAVNENTGRAVGDVLAELLDAEVAQRALPGARIRDPLPTGALGFRIAAQRLAGRWDWIVVNGGGNDLLLCGCALCEGTLRALVRKDGRAGAIPRLAVDLRATGARVIWAGYLRSPGRRSPVAACRNEGDALEARIARMAALVEGIEFVSLADLVPEGDASFHALDRVHPSPKGSRAIAERIAARIRAVEDAARP